MELNVSEYLPCENKTFRTCFQKFCLKKYLIITVSILNLGRDTLILTETFVV